MEIPEIKNHEIWNEKVISDQVRYVPASRSWVKDKTELWPGFLFAAHQRSFCLETLIPCSRTSGSKSMAWEKTASRNNFLRHHRASTLLLQIPQSQWWRLTQELWAQGHHPLLTPSHTCLPSIGKRVQGTQGHFTAYDNWQPFMTIFSL